MHTTGFAVLKFIKPDIIKIIFKDGREDDFHGLELNGVDLEIIVLSGIKFLKARQSPVITLINEHQDSGQHFIKTLDNISSVHATCSYQHLIPHLMSHKHTATRYHQIGGNKQLTHTTP